jgi:integrase/recombinase XerD
MLETFFTDARVVARLRRGAYGRSIDDLAVFLAERGYKQVTAQAYLRAAGHCAFWLESRGIRSAAVDERALVRFLAHLGACHCAVPVGLPRSDMAASVGHFLTVLRRAGRAPPPHVPPTTPVDLLLAAYDDHLAHTRGATAKTRAEYGRYVREFLVAGFSRRPLRPGCITPVDIIRFVCRRAARCSSGTGLLVATSMRSFLRFLQMRGQSAPSVVDAVPHVPKWKLARVPVTLTEEQVAAFLAAFDRSTATGLRDFAMAQCLLGLGLRAGEVARLALADIDWRAGTVCLGRTKSRRSSRLPLPCAVGRAIIAYLRGGRPRGADPMVFVRHLLPIGAPISTSVVRVAMRRAFERSAVPVPSMGTHALRHTAAARMLRGGATMKELADVLRHTSIDSTMAYTKVDLERLAAIALPWPEVRP